MASLAFVPSTTLPLSHPTALSAPRRRPRHAAADDHAASAAAAVPWRGARVRMTADTDAGAASDGAPSPEDQARIERMRSRLAGLFGQADESARSTDDGVFDGAALRAAIEGRWGVQYDVQPQKRGDRVYVQIMWRYFEQQSFYMDEEEFSNHCEAVAILLNRWDAVDYFCDYIASSKKRPVVGITINILIPGVRASTETF